VRRPGVLVGPESLDEVAVGGDVLQPVEGDAAALLDPDRLVMLPTGRLVRAEGGDQVRVGRDVLKTVDRGQDDAPEGVGLVRGLSHEAAGTARQCRADRVEGGLPANGTVAGASRLSLPIFGRLPSLVGPTMPSRRASVNRLDRGLGTGEPTVNRLPRQAGRPMVDILATPSSAGVADAAPDERGPSSSCLGAWRSHGKRTLVRAGRCRQQKPIQGSGLAKCW
jgi:hypothetical protein